MTVDPRRIDSPAGLSRGLDEAAGFHALQDSLSRMPGAKLPGRLATKGMFTVGLALLLLGGALVVSQWSHNEIEAVTPVAEPLREIDAHSLLVAPDMLSSPPPGPVMPAASEQVQREAVNAPPSRLESELIADARRALADAPEETLHLVRRAELEYPLGQLVPERKALEIRALVALGRLREANEKAQRFLLQHDHTPLADVVRRALP